MNAWWLAYVAVGGVSGFFAGLMGVGGGGIIVPLLAMMFTAQQFPAEHIMHMALGTSLATIVFTSISSLRAHHQHGAVLWPVVKAITPGVALGTFLGAQVVGLVSTQFLAIFFVLFMAYVSVQMIVNAKPKPSRELPGPGGMFAVGSGIGGVSALVAIGGGSLSVPFMTWCNVRMHHAIGTSAAIGLPIALAGTVGYLVSGYGIGHLPPASLGFIYLPALALMVAASVTTAPFGARLAHRLPVAVLKRIFAAVLLLLSAKMLHSLF
ncbi:sulfite exporter TauE/SafE family protein [Denitratisoma sp. agr-D3]